MMYGADIHPRWITANIEVDNLTTTTTGECDSFDGAPLCGANNEIGITATFD